MTSKHWWREHGKLAIVSLVILGITALGWFLAMSMVRPLMHQSFRERSLAYVQAFASSAAPWIDPVQPAMLQSASRFMLVGSGQYVQIVINGALIADERSEESANSDLALPIDEITPGIQDAATGNDGVLDILVPLFPATSLDRGYVRMGIDSSSVVQRLRLLAMWSAAVALGAGLVLVMLVWWLLGFRFAVFQHRDTKGEPDTSRRERMIGDLRIDESGRQILFKGTRLSCTPKQYALLAFLAQEPDRVFSEREIVNSVWEASSYADSKDVKQYVYLVRRNLAAIHPAGKHLIETVPGFGYKLVSQIIDEELTDD